MFGLFTKKGKTAHLGEENTLYYNEELKRWVERGKEHEVEEETIPPPPTVSSSIAGLTQTRPDTADPSSRYVVAGGFGKAGNQSPEHEKFSFLAPAAISAPKTTGFLVPAVLPSEQSTPHEEPSSEAVETQKYKGFRIPIFQKPESVDGTQQEYEEKELEKWKAKIDKREARKQNGIDTISPKTQNRRMGSGKLDNDWLMEDQSTPDLAFTSTQSFTAVEQVFTPAPNSALNPEHENQPIGVLPVDPTQEPVSMKADWDHPIQEDYLEHNGHQSWKNNVDPSPQLEDEIDFDSWDKAVEEPIVPMEAPDENPYKEAEYPGGIRETEDPFDIAWLTQTGWNDHEQCRSITQWMCQNYQQEWRDWHRSNPIWDQFWCWYYDGGDEIIHSSASEAKPKEDAKVNGIHGVEAPKLELNSELGLQKEYSDYVPEDDEDVWGIPENQKQFFENRVEFPSQDAWKETPQVECDDADNVGTPPFEIFTHDGMLQFLHKLDSILNDLTPQSLAIGEFHQQVKQLVVSVEAQNEDKNDFSKTSAASLESVKLKEDLQRKEQEIEELQLQLESSNQNSSLQIKLTELEEFVSKQEQTIEALKTNFQNSESVLMKSQQQVEVSSHQIKALEDQMESKENELIALRDQLRNQVESNNQLVQTSSEESEKLKKENKILKKKVLSLMKKSEDQVSSNPASPISVTNDQCFTEKSASANQNSESDGQLTKQITVLKKKLLEQKKALEEKETQISGLLEAEKAKLELQAALEETKKELEEKIKLTEELSDSLLVKETEISQLRNEGTQRLEEIDKLKHLEESEPIQELKDEDLKDRRLARLEDDLQQKQQDIKRLEMQIQSIPQKDSLISKLSALIGENDNHLQQLRISLEENRKKEIELLDSLSAKDTDLENLVNSVMISQKQIIQLQDYCFQLGGNPSEVLTVQHLGN